MTLWNIQRGTKIFQVQNMKCFVKEIGKNEWRMNVLIYIKQQHTTRTKNAMHI
jgi:hypothetical protein